MVKLLHKPVINIENYDNYGIVHKVSCNIQYTTLSTVLHNLPQRIHMYILCIYISWLLRGCPIAGLS